MVPFARLIRMSAAAAAFALAGFWLSGCSEASRMETQVRHRRRGRLHPARRHVREWPRGAARPGPGGARLRPGLRGRRRGRVQHAGRNRRADRRHRRRPAESGAAVREGLRGGQLARLPQPGPRGGRAGGLRAGVRAVSEVVRRRMGRRVPPRGRQLRAGRGGGEGRHQGARRLHAGLRRRVHRELHRARPASILPARSWPRTRRPRCASTGRRCRSTRNPARLAYDADCAEADKLRTRVTLIAATTATAGPAADAGADHQVISPAGGWRLAAGGHFARSPLRTITTSQDRKMSAFRN